MKKFMDKPITWGGYLKLCGICSLIGCVSWAWAWYKCLK